MSVFRLASRTTRLREAAATIFALSTVLPLLVLIFFFWRFDLLWETEVQAGIFVALIVAVLGFVVFRRLVGRIADLAQHLSTPETASAAAAAAARHVPGVGTVGEIGEIAGAFGRLLEDLRGSTQRLEDLVFKLGTLNEMADLATRIPNPHDLLDVVLERSMRVTGAHIGSIMLLEADGRTLKLVAGRGLPEGVKPGAQGKVGEGVAGRVVELGQPVLVDDIHADPRFGKVSEERYGGGSFIGMPIRVGERVIGVLNLARKEYATGASAEHPAFGFNDLQFLSTLMGYAAYAVDNARLLEETKASAQRLGEIVDVQRIHVRELADKSRLLEEAKTDAERANRFKSQFLAVMSHELRTPLNSIIGFAKVLLRRLDGELTPQQEAHLGTLLASAVHLLHLINSVLDMASIEAGKVELRIDRVDLESLVRECLETSEPLARDKALALETDVPASLPPIAADRMKVKQILLNLISNAIKFTRQGRVRVAVRPDTTVVQVSVMDTGIGISDDDLPRLFEAFHHRESPVTREISGTGLGLAISKRFVELHGGRIWVETKRERGSTFFFTLPLQQQR
jgi:signal transduction histidine kinase